MSYTFRAFRAVDDYATSMEFHTGHTKILTDLGIENLTSNIPVWIEDPNVYVITARSDDDGSVVGGIRIHIKSIERSLPIELALMDLDSGIKSRIEEYVASGVAESCGLWNAKKVFGRGLSPLLARVSVSGARLLGLKSLICFSAPYTLKMIQQLGFVPMQTVGLNGTFPYPTEKYISTVLVIPILEDLSWALETERQRILSLIDLPNQCVLESSQGKEIAINYNLSALSLVENRR